MDTAIAAPTTRTASGSVAVPAAAMLAAARGGQMPLPTLMEQAAALQAAGDAGAAAQLYET